MSLPREWTMKGDVEIVRTIHFDYALAYWIFRQLWTAIAREDRQIFGSSCSSPARQSNQGATRPQ